MNKKKIYIFGAGRIGDEYFKVILKQYSHICNLVIITKTKTRWPKILQKYKKYKDYFTLSLFSEFKDYHLIKFLILALPPQKTLYILGKIDHQQEVFILSEKPIVLNFSQLNNLIKLIKQTNFKFFVSLNRRFYESNNYIKNKITKNKDKKIIKIQDSQSTTELKKLGFSNLEIKYWHFYNSIHLVDLSRWFIDGNILKKDIIIGKPKSKFYSVKVTFDSGDILIYDCVWNSPGGWGLDLYSKSFSFKCFPLEKLYFSKKNSNPLKLLKEEKDNYKPGFLKMIDKFIIKNNGFSIFEYQESFSLLKYIYEK